MMAKNSGKQWTGADVAKLKKLVDGNTPTPLIAYKTSRTENAIRAKAKELRISLKPVNKSPYTRKKK